MLGQLFKPRWQHRHATVRADAVEHLDSTRDQATLADLARGDTSARVRARAAGLLTDIGVLDRLLQGDGDSEVQEAASLRLMALLAGTVDGAPDGAERLRLIRHTDNPRVLRYVVEHSPDRSCREAALNLITDAPSLFDLALNGRGAALRLAAARALTDPALLRKLARQGRDKQVIRHAREQARHYQHQEEERHRRHRDAESLVAALRQLAGQAADPLYLAKLQQLEQRWSELAADLDEAQSRQAEDALAQCRQRRLALEEEQQAALALEQAHREAGAALDTLRELLTSVTTETWDQQLGELRSAVATQERRWQAAGQDATRLGSPLEARLDRALQAEHQRWQTLLELASEAPRVTDEESHDGRARLAAHWPAGVPRPSALNAPSSSPVAAAGGGPGPAQAAPRKSPHTGLVVALRRELQRGNLKHANRLWHKAERALTDAEDPWLHRQLQQLTARREELRDWHAFAAQPKKDNLCERVEALAAATPERLDPVERASEVQALHEEWRALMSSDQDQDQALWDRFKAASDRAYAPCRAHFAEQDALCAENRQRRAALCDQLHDFMDGQNWDRADWQAVWEIRRQAPRDWKALSPVRFTEVRDLQKRFSALLADLDARLEQAWEQAEQRRETLIEAARALNQQDDIQAAIRDARPLQQQWRATPWLPPQRHRRYQKRFRAEMDRLFAARDTAAQQQKEERQAARQRLGPVWDRVNQQLALPAAQQDEQALTECASQLANLDAGLLSRDDERRRRALMDDLRQYRRRLPLWRRWRSARDSLMASADASLNEGNDDPASDGDDRRLTVALEVLAGVDTPEQDREARLAWQLEQLPRTMKSSGFSALEEALRLVGERPARALPRPLAERLDHALAALEPPLPGDY